MLFFSVAKMNFFSTITVVGIALILSVSTIQLPPASEFPKILPDNAPFLNYTTKEVCTYYALNCGWVSSLDETIVFVRLACVCPSGQQCEYSEPSKEFPDSTHLYKCAKKP